MPHDFLLELLPVFHCLHLGLGAGHRGRGRDRRRRRLCLCVQSRGAFLFRGLLLGEQLHAAGCAAAHCRGAAFLPGQRPNIRSKSSGSALQWIMEYSHSTTAASQASSSTRQIVEMPSATAQTQVAGQMPRRDYRVGGQMQNGHLKRGAGRLVLELPRLRTSPVGRVLVSTGSRQRNYSRAEGLQRSMQLPRCPWSCLRYCCTLADRMGRPNRIRPSACRSLELNEFAHQMCEPSPLDLTGRKSGTFTVQSTAPTPLRMPWLGCLWMQRDV